MPHDLCRPYCMFSPQQPSKIVPRSPESLDTRAGQTPDSLPASNKPPVDPSVLSTPIKASRVEEATDPAPSASLAHNFAAPARRSSACAPIRIGSCQAPSARSGSACVVVHLTYLCSWLFRQQRYHICDRCCKPSRRSLSGSPFDHACAGRGGFHAGRISR